LIRACLTERPLWAWRELFTRIEKSTFLHTNERGWVSLDWMIKGPDAALKVLEGQYDNKSPPRRRDVGRLTLAEWTCPHDPHCTHRMSCQLLVDIAAAKAVSA
jgi:hypothetical protein